jgi:transposase-like protein
MLRETTISTLDFVKTVLRYCKNKPCFVVDEGPWYTGVFQRLGVRREHETFGRRSKVESVFSSYKQRSRVYFNNFNINFKGRLKKEDKRLWWRRALQQANFFAFTFIIYYNQLR